jgi:ADP-ribosylglycohydrolase/protein-tyrosine phosphatase
MQNSQRTSQTDPLQIGEIRLGHEAQAAVGLTFCPGKKHPDSLSGNWQRDLKADLLAIKGWGAIAVVTLMSQAELDAVQVGNIGEGCEALGMEWHHLPLKAAGAFDDLFEQQWLYAGLRLRRHLQLNRRIVIHCQSGMGRTAMVAGRLLMEMDWAAESAVNAVLQARPAALDPEVLAGHIRSIRKSEYDEAFLERMLGLLLGGAVGDGFGYAIEFDSLKTIKEKFGSKGFVEPTYTDGKLVVSDDTQMTLFTVEALIRGINEFGEWDQDTMVKRVRSAYRGWLATQTGGKAHDGEWELCNSKALRHKRAPGNTCLSALIAGGQGTIERPTNDSKGCGAVMRTAPIGLLPNSDRNAAQRLGEAIGALTHGHIDGWLPAGAVAGLIERLMKGNSLKSAVNAVWKHLESYPSPEVANRYGTYRLLGLAAQLSAKFKTRPIEAIRLLGEGWTGDEALAIAVYSAMSSKNFCDTIRRAANHDGDSDTTASIAGQLYGAFKGVFSIPHAWIRRLDVFDEILMVTSRWMPWINSAAPATSYASGAVSYREMKGRILNVLKMVQILHTRGYQRLRTSPGESPSGCHFRVVITSANNIRSDNGALTVDYWEGTARYTTGDYNHYFGWRDATEDGPLELADKFLERFPEIAEAGRGRDWLYSGWYNEMLGFAESGQIPNAYFDYWNDPPPGTMHVLDRREGSPYLPAPPGGEGPSTKEIDAKFETQADDSEGDDGAVSELEDEEDLALRSAEDEQEDAPPPLSSFDMSDPTQRTIAIFTFYNYGLDQLIPFTQQIWDQLNEPKGKRVAKFAILAGINGASKLTLRKILVAFYEEASAARDEASSKVGFVIQNLLTDSAEMLSKKMDEYCEALADATMAMAEKYSLILNGEDPCSILQPKSGDIIQGPWKPKGH